MIAHDMVVLFIVVLSVYNGNTGIGCEGGGYLNLSIKCPT